ncbi:MAG: hypothetical protein C0467_14070 [Planctomycetaceae bacterium]|nr:hypothetical protein [Planctomycetaceae bacterium]
MISYLINLKRRPDRLQESLKACEQAGISPLVWEATDGQAATVPSSFLSGPGAWGCKMSHANALADAIAKGHSQIAVFEDDVIFCPDFAQRLPLALAALPDSWQALMLGGQHIKPPLHVNNHIVQCVNCHRTHAYILNGLDYIQRLHDIYSNSSVHIDHSWGYSQESINTVYAPKLWLCGQRASYSNITNRVNSAKYWHCNKALKVRK